MYESYTTDKHCTYGVGSVTASCDGTCRDCHFDTSGFVDCTHYGYTHDKEKFLNMPTEACWCRKNSPRAKLRIRQWKKLGYDWNKLYGKE